MKHRASSWVVGVAWLGAGCAGQIEGPSPEVAELTGRLGIRVDPPTGTDVVAIRVKVVPAGSACGAPPLQEKVAVIRPDVVLGPAHPVSDAFFVLAAGSFRVCATPISDVMTGTASAVCGPAESVAMVMPEGTTEIELVSQCKGEARGGLDVLGTLNRPPVITALDLSPSKLVLVGNDVDMVVTADDPDLDFLTFTFTQVSGPAPATITPMGAHAVFTASVAGDYQVRVVVTDGRGGSATLTFPIHVAG
jgi:hypothetical protein